MLTPIYKTPYYSVIFSSIKTDGHKEEYEKYDALLSEIAPKQPGFLGIESVRDNVGKGITISYWKDRLSIVNWKKNAQHLAAQLAGKERFYENYVIRVCKVESNYDFIK